MLRLRIDQILKEKNKSKYWLFKKLEPMSYQNFNNIYSNKTSSIKFETLEKLSKALEIPVGDLFINDDSQ